MNLAVRDGQIPHNWSRVKLGEILQVVRGISFPSDVKATSLKQGYVACLRTTNVQREVEWGDLWYVPDSYVKRTEQWVRKNDILISVANSLELVGKVALVSSLPQEATLGTFISLIRVPDSANPKFIYYQLISDRVQQDLKSRASTTTNISNISTQKLLDTSLLIPPLSDQQHIVDAIETQFTRLDAAVAALKRVQANLRRHRAAVLKAACEGRLVPTEAQLAPAEGRAYEPAAALLERILAERRAKWQAEHPGKKYKEPAGPDVSGLPELPEGWCWATVEQLIAQPLMNGHSVNTAHDGFPVLRLTAIRNGSIALDERKPGAWSAEQASAYLVRLNDFFVSRGNGSLALVGRGGLVEQQPMPVAFPDTMIRLVTGSAVNRRYLRAIWDSLLVREQIERSAKTTAGIHKINQQDISRYVLPLPPLAEQATIVAEIEHQMSTEQALASSLSASLRRAERLRQSILQRAFSGQLVELRLPQSTNHEQLSLELS